MTRTFTCAICHEHCGTEWTEEEARAESERRWGPLPEGWNPQTDERVVSICDDCDRALQSIITPLGLDGDWDGPTNDAKWAQMDFRCFRCHRVPGQIEEYREAVVEAGTKLSLITCVAYVVNEEGTFNAENGHFACTQCYIALGMPTGEGGQRWIAP